MYRIRLSKKFKNAQIRFLSIWIELENHRFVQSVENPLLILVFTVTNPNWFTIGWLVQVSETYTNTEAYAHEKHRKCTQWFVSKCMLWFWKCLYHEQEKSGNFSVVWCVYYLWISCDRQYLARFWIQQIYWQSKMSIWMNFGIWIGGYNLMNQIDILTFLHEFSLNCLHRQRKQDFPLVSCRTSMLCTSQVSREHICNTARNRSFMEKDLYWMKNF